MSRFVPPATGWRPDLPDARDLTFRHPEIAEQLNRLRIADGSRSAPAIDLRRDDEGEYFNEVENQGSLGSSSAFAVLGLLEYFQRRLLGQVCEGSKLFLYQATCHFYHFCRPPCPVDADLRTTLKLLVKVGVPLEEHWPYVCNNFSIEPSPLVYSLVLPTLGVRYFRLEEANQTGERTWEVLKSFLSAGFPVVFGFSVPASLSTDPDILYRPDLDRPRSGQAVLAVGYDEHHFGRGQQALLIRSSWGSAWGDNGHGWLPQAFVRQQLARDFWTLIREDWLDSEELSRPSILD